MPRARPSGPALTFPGGVPMTMRMRRVLGPMHDDRERSLAYRVAAALWLTAVLEVPLYLLMPHPFPTHVGLVLFGAGLGLAMSAYTGWASTHQPSVWVLQLGLLLGIGVVALSMAGLGGSASPSRVYLLPMIVFSASFFRSPVFLAVVVLAHTSPLLYEPVAWSNGFLLEAALAAPVYVVLWFTIGHSKRSLLAVRDQAERVGRTDALTGLANRRGFREAFDADGFQRPAGSLLYLDVDHFKRLNDEHGHDVGDTALEALGAAIRACSRRHDVAARLGGEEFVVWLDGSDEATALVVAERIRRRFREQFAAATGLSLTLSVGAASGSVADLDALVRRADAAMYVAKTAGRNRVVAA